MLKRLLIKILVKLKNYEGNFIYVDRETINSIEDVAAFILDLIDEQEKR